ncbi:MAG: alpha/beta hydrolase [Muribaculaceae bacterium]|nr:alpha/beta hydrolase [Muribaculaceae bacterium]
MRKFVLSVLTYILSFSAVNSNLPENFIPSKEEAAAMLMEADNFLDSLPDGMQDRQADAIYHAIRGMSGELDKIRENRNSSLPTPSEAVKVTDITGDEGAAGIKMRLYRPSNSTFSLPLLIYFHGGGWCFGSIASCSSFCESLTSTGKAMVLAVEYSLAPENPFPKAIDECCASVMFASSNMINWNASSISLGGDSAGGNLALATALSMQDSEKFADSPAIKSLVLFYPVVKTYAAKSYSWKRYARGYGLNARLMEAFNEAYNSSKEEALASPIKADNEALKKLPPILIVNAERDILLDQGKEFSDRLLSLGKDVTNVVFPGAVHLFITVKGQPTAFKKAIDLTASFLSSH